MFSTLNVVVVVVVIVVVEIVITSNIFEICFTNLCINLILNIKKENEKGDLVELLVIESSYGTTYNPHSRINKEQLQRLNL